jgi:phosphoesterase RecJ-like protein
MRLIGKVLYGIEFHKNGQICLMTLTLKMLEETGADESSVEGLVDQTMHSRGVVVGALLKERQDGSTRVSFRSNNGIDVAAIARAFGGGGHLSASGCTLSFDLSDARLKVLEALAAAVEERGI